MNNISLVARFKEQADRSQEFISSGRDAGFSQKRMELGDLIDNSIKNDIKDDSFKKLNIKNKLSELIALLNDSDNVEYSHIVYKSTTGKDFNGFIRDVNAKWLKGLTFVIRMKDDKNKYFYKNTVLLEVTLSKEGNDEFNFILKNIILMNFPKAPHANVRGMIVPRENFKFELNTGKMTGSDLTWMNGLRKPIDLWEDDSKLNVNLWRGITRRLSAFNISRKRMNIPIFALDEEIEIKTNGSIKLIAFMPKEFEASLNTRYFLNNLNDSSLKGGFWMKKTPKDFVPTLISELSNEIEFCEEENIKLLSNIKNEELVEEELNDRRTHEEHIYSTAKAKRAEKYSNVLEQEWEITEIKSNVKEIVTQFKRKTTGFSSDLKAAKNELSKLSKPQKKKKNDKSPKKDNSKAIIDIKATISSIENILKEIEDKVLIVNEEAKNKIDAFKKVIDRENAELSIMDKEIKNLKSNVSDVVNALLVSSNKITSMNEKTTKNSSRKLTLLKNQDIITEMNIETNIVLLEGTGSVDDRKKRVINISSFDNDKMYSNPKKYLDNCEWQVSDYDHGFATVIKRNNMAMFNLSNGNYKSPYLAIDLNNPTSKIKRLDTSLHGDLNEKQKEAFKMINNSYQASFLQGPPGTGKTQVISNIIAYYAEKGEVSLISSSTNEAINNALERINKDQFNNPNVFFLRVTNSKDQKEKAKEFLEDKIPFNFISKMIRFSKGEKEEESLANEIIENFSKEEINSYIPLVYFKKFKNKETVHSNAEFFSAFLDEPLEDAEYFYDDSVSKWNKLLRKTNTAIKNETSISTKIEKLYSTKLNEVNDCKVSTYDFISRYKNNSKGSMFDELVNDVMSSIKAKDEIDKELNSEIIKTVSANNLINIVGITTTSRQEITINGERREIFTDYPIDFAVIDEVSKSITPEVIQISSLSSKFLYAGDYRQLPPAMDIPSTYISEFWKWEKAQERDNQFDKILKERNISDEEEFEELLNDLYDGTLFKNQVIKLKSGEHSESSYVALDVQHRFTDEIQDLVNVVYDDSEKLSQYDGHKENHFNEYAIYGPDTKASTLLFDTSYISNEFVEFAHANNAKYIPTQNDVAFDQTRSIFGRGMSYKSMINEYNAFEGISILMNLKNKNPHLDPRDIGYICMTRSQANMISKGLLAKSMAGTDWDLEWLRKVKIDTVDNFQGREKDIVIVDLVRAQNHIGNGSYKLNERTNRNLGFYSRNERLNVAVSRAKSKLILIGAIEGHLEEGVVSDVEKNGRNTKMRIFRKYKQIIEKNGKVIQAWTK